MNEEYLKKGQVWVKEVVVDTSDIARDIAYCDYQIASANKLIEEMTARKASLTTIKTDVAETLLAQAETIREEVKPQQFQQTEILQENTAI